MVTEEEQKPRLYTNTARAAPADDIPPHHQDIHQLLDRWAMWQRERYSAETCASMEKLYYRGGRDATPPETAPKPPDPKLEAVDQAWRLMVRRVPQHAEAIFLFYIARQDPRPICRHLRLHWTEWPRWMKHCRAMVINLMKELDR